ncbi:MAG: type II toxin-antitoxin system VapC family toxin [Micropepsaceae bacterium]
MIIDASALIAILREEPDAGGLRNAIAIAERRRISAATYVETSIVIDSQRDPVASRRLDDFLTRTQTEIVPFTETQAKLAREAYRAFGKGSGHPARLNFGDCMAYALAKDLGEPLLFKGDDFTKAGIDAA